jgi:uncharacterized protein YukE
VNSKIKVHIPTMAQAGDDLAAAAATSRSTLGSLASKTALLNAGAVGSVGEVVVQAFWHRFSQHVQSSADVFDEIASALGSAASQYHAADVSNAGQFPPDMTGTGSIPGGTDPGAIDPGGVNPPPDPGTPPPTPPPDPGPPPTPPTDPGPPPPPTPTPTPPPTGPPGGVG